MSLKDYLYSKCTQDQINTRDCPLIVSIASVGRTKPNFREIGNGTILETIGIDEGNALLDVLSSDARFRHVKPLLEQGRLIISSPLVTATLQSMVGTVLQQSSVDKLVALGQVPDLLTVEEVASALYNKDGSLK